MKELTLEDSKRVQLELLKEFDSFCTAHKINYSASFGTLLGAIRHKGYIPWDDDIDVFLMREDYLRFVKEYNETDKFRVSSLENDPFWDRPTAKLYNKSTICKELCSSKVIIGLGIDIFPVDSIVDDKAERKKYRNKLFALRDIYDIKMMSWNKERTLIKNLFVLFGRIVLFPFSQRKIAEFINSYSQKYNKTQTKLVCDNIEGYKESEPYLRDSFASYIQAPFEDMHVSIAKGYHDILTKDYGDYMKLPPVEKQVTHHRTKVYWK